MKSLCCSALLVIGSMFTSHDGVGAVPTPRPDRATRTATTATVAPILSGVPKRVSLPRDGSAQPITLTGDHFGPHVSVQLDNMSYVYTYARTSLKVINARTLEFDGALIEAGTYTIRVRAGRQQSAAMTIEVARR